jgi:hypothetical protein
MRSNRNFCEFRGQPPWPPLTGDLCIKCGSVLRKSEITLARKNFWIPAYAGMTFWNREKSRVMWTKVVRETVEETLNSLLDAEADSAIAGGRWFCCLLYF